MWEPHSLWSRYICGCGAEQTTHTDGSNAITRHSNQISVTKRQRVMVVNDATFYLTAMTEEAV